MAIYKLGSEEGYDFLQPVDPAHWRVFREQFAGQPIGEPWRPIKMRRITIDEGGVSLKPSDLPWVTGNTLVLGAKALTVLGELVRPHGQLLSLDCEGATCYVLNVTTVVDALDEERSRVLRFDSGQILGVTAYVLRADQLRDVPIFKLPQTLRQDVFVSDTFVDVANRHDLRGVCFHQLGQQHTETDRRGGQ